MTNVVIYGIRGQVIVHSERAIRIVNIRHIAVIIVGVKYHGCLTIRGDGGCGVCGTIPAIVKSLRSSKRSGGA